MNATGSGCSWDSFDAYLFDIDGTLLHCRDAVHYFAFCEVLTSIAGRALTLDGVATHGNTDMGIVRDALRLAACHDTSPSASPLWKPLFADAPCWPTIFRRCERFGRMARSTSTKLIRFHRF